MNFETKMKLLIIFQFDLIFTKAPLPRCILDMLSWNFKYFRNIYFIAADRKVCVSTQI